VPEDSRVLRARRSVFTTSDRLKYGTPPSFFLSCVASLVVITGLSGGPGEDPLRAADQKYHGRGIDLQPEKPFFSASIEAAKQDAAKKQMATAAEVAEQEAAEKQKVPAANGAAKWQTACRQTLACRVEGTSWTHDAIKFWHCNTLCFVIASITKSPRFPTMHHESTIC